MKKRIINFAAILLIILSIFWLMINFNKKARKQIGTTGEGANINMKNTSLRDNKPGDELSGASTPEEALLKAVEAIKTNNIDEALKMFAEESRDRIKNSLIQIDSASRKKLAHSLETAVFDENAKTNLNTFKTYTTQIEGEGRDLVTVHFYMLKLPNGNWVINDL